MKPDYKEGDLLVAIKDCSYYNKGDKMKFLRYDSHNKEILKAVKLSDNEDYLIYSARVKKLNTKLLDIKKSILK